jgi:hypothetical protein
MKRTLFILGILFLPMTGLLAQQGTVIPKPVIKGNNNAVSLGINIPLGEFAQTHFGGIGADYSWSHHRFGRMTEMPKKRIGFTADAAVDYYAGKKGTVAGYPYKYGGYVYIHAFGGAMYNFSLTKYSHFRGFGDISLLAGPAIGIYKSGNDPGFGIQLSSHYHINDKIAMRPVIIYMKRGKANALWAAGLQAAYNF